MNNSAATYAIRFIGLILAQLLIFDHINFLGSLNPYPYILCIIFYPIINQRIGFLFFSFLVGLLLDFFLDSGGIHATASLCISYVRPLFLKFFFGATYEHQSIKFSSVSSRSKFIYMGTLIGIHHFIIFFLDFFSISKISLTFEKTLYTGLFTFVLCVLFSILFRRNKS